MTFHIGQQVVCVDANRSDVGVEVPLVKNAIYTVSGFSTNYWGQTGLLLAEVGLPSKLCGHHPAYRPERFRPVTKTDISIFTAMLVNAPQRETV